jgi:hypothetical protein
MALARPFHSIALLPLLLCLLASPAFGQSDFITFESGQVRPLLLTPDGSTLLALNTPDNTLEIFSVGVAGLVHTDSVPVGMEPVALAIPGNVANEDEVWVVNHMSDSISIIDLAASPPQVVRTLLVGDEPRDIVFAGTNGDRASSRQRTAASTEPTPPSPPSAARGIRSSPPRASAAPTSGSSTRPALARRWAARRTRS